MNIYQQHGYENRLDYLTNLSFDYDVNLDSVLALADMLGPREDFDGLVAMLQDA